MTNDAIVGVSGVKECGKGIQLFGWVGYFAVIINQQVETGDEGLDML